MHAVAQEKEIRGVDRGKKSNTRIRLQNRAERLGYRSTWLVSIGSHDRRVSPRAKIETTATCMTCSTRFVVSVILSGQSRDDVLDTIHTRLLDLGDEMRAGKIDILEYEINRVSRLSVLLSSSHPASYLATIQRSQWLLGCKEFATRSNRRAFQHKLDRAQNEARRHDRLHRLRSMPSIPSIRVAQWTWL